MKSNELFRHEQQTTIRSFPELKRLFKTLLALGIGLSLSLALVLTLAEQYTPKDAASLHDAVRSSMSQNQADLEGTPHWIDSENPIQASETEGSGEPLVTPEESALPTSSGIHSGDLLCDSDTISPSSDTSFACLLKLLADGEYVSTVAFNIHPEELSERLTQLQQYLPNIGYSYDTETGEVIVHPRYIITDTDNSMIHVFVPEANRSSSGDFTCLSDNTPYEEQAIEEFIKQGHFFQSRTSNFKLNDIESPFGTTVLTTVFGTHTFQVNGNVVRSMLNTPDYHDVAVAALIAERAVATDTTLHCSNALFADFYPDRYIEPLRIYPKGSRVLVSRSLDGDHTKEYLEYAAQLGLHINIVESAGNDGILIEPGNLSKPDVQVLAFSKENPDVLAYYTNLCDPGLRGYCVVENGHVVIPVGGEIYNEEGSSFATPRFTSKYLENYSARKKAGAPLLSVQEFAYLYYTEEITGNKIQFATGSTEQVSTVVTATENILQYVFGQIPEGAAETLQIDFYSSTWAQQNAVPYFWDQTNVHMIEPGKHEIIATKTIPDLLLGPLRVRFTLETEAEPQVVEWSISQAPRVRLALSEAEEIKNLRPVTAHSTYYLQKQVAGYSWDPTTTPQDTSRQVSTVFLPTIRK